MGWRWWRRWRGAVRWNQRCNSTVNDAEPEVRPVAVEILRPVLIQAEGVPSAGRWCVRSAKTLPKSYKQLTYISFVH